MGLKLRQSPGNNWPEGEGKGKEEPGEQKGASKLALSWLKLYLWHRLFSLNKQASDPSTRWEAVRGRHTLNFPFPAWLGWSQKKKVTAAPGNHGQEEVKHRRMFKRPQVPWHSGRASLPHPQPGSRRQGTGTSLQTGWHVEQAPRNRPDIRHADGQQGEQNCSTGAFSKSWKIYLISPRCPRGQEDTQWQQKTRPFRKLRPACKGKLEMDTVAATENILTLTHQQND